MKHKGTGTTEPPEDQPPPPYEAVPQDIQGIRVNNDGRISIDASSRLCKTLSKLIPNVPRQSLPPPSYEDLVPTPGFNLNIVIQIVGSRGDVQPFIALGTELQRTGHRVRIATHNVFEQFVAQAGLEFYPIGGNPADMMAYMVKNPGLIPSMNSLRGGDIQKNRLMMAEILHGCWSACLMPDPVTNAPFVANAIIANPPSFAHVHCAQALGIPLHLMFTMPWTATRAFPHPLANLFNIPPDQDWINRVSYSVVDWLSWQGLGGVINDWRIHELGLEPISLSDGPFLLRTLQIPYTYCWSPGLVPKPDDWPENSDVCGFFFRDPPDYEPTSEVAAFLNAGPPPIYIGFGSIVIDEPDKMIEILLQAILETGVRAIISRGWSNLSGPALPHILYLDDCPHEWLFQHVSAVVHHGGAGTTACGLRNGKPTVIVPFFGDQPFWGDMISAARAGPDPIPHKQLNISRLVQAFRYCLTPQAIRAAQVIASGMQQEDGVKAAVASFHKHLPRLVACELLPQLPASWKCKKGKKRYYLSKVAAEILVENNLLDVKKLKPYQPSPIYIEKKRWDPVTGVYSAGLGMTFDMLKAGGDIIYKPYEVYKGGSSNPSSSSHSQKNSPQLLSPVPSTPGDNFSLLRKARSMNDLTDTDRLEPKEKGKALAMASASAQASRKFLGRFVSGTLVDLPLAAAEGFRVLPGLYGDKVHENERVKDWKSGVLAGAKTFAVGMAESLVDPLYQPYKGARDGGALGFAGGIFKGTFGVLAKMGHAGVGLVAYPGQGIKRSIQAAFNDSTRTGIVTSMHEEGQDLLRQWRVRGLQDGIIIEKFLRMGDKDDSGDDSDYV
ncbi:hypothetical protein N7520_009055 [Penicillium odoratum]|uniref:uncharacterized protein n=1 Tax=Penicillium odoratum TaxID=1167516 RepID=UPI0025485F0A|nr:uncharacterized protein N7520_009055 [Penicillium odoratum]KAJ5752138.1 hypothetical protein N7520_009055 [Penicillium odoratum]